MRYGDGVLPIDLQFLKVVESIEALASAKGIGKNSKLHKKVQRLAEPFTEPVGMADGEAALAKRVRVTRNWYVHHGDRWKGRRAMGVTCSGCCSSARR